MAVLLDRAAGACHGGLARQESGVFDGRRVCWRGLQTGGRDAERAASLRIAMNIIAVGLNHRTAPVELRERFAVSDSRLPEALARLKRWPGIDEGVILSTCNRVELYAVVKETAHGVESLRDYLVTLASDISWERLEPHLYGLDGAEAIRHLFRVAASLDSMVLGGPQILGQGKEAYDVALLPQATGGGLDKMMKKTTSSTFWSKGTS